MSGRYVVTKSKGVVESKGATESRGDGCSFVFWTLRAPCPFEVSLIHRLSQMPSRRDPW